MTAESCIWRNWKPLRSNSRWLPLPTDRPWGGSNIGLRQRHRLRCRRLFVFSCWVQGWGYSQERYLEAEPLHQQALEMRRCLLGESHPDVASSLSGLALLYESQGKYLEAESLYQQALEMRRSQLGESHPHVAESLNNLALLYSDQGRYTEAEPLYQQALEIAERSFGVNHPKTITYRKNLNSLRDNHA